MEKPNCMTCEHLRCDPGDAWTPTTYYCDWCEDEEDCKYYEFHDYEQEAYEDWTRKQDAPLQGWDWREARGDYDR